MNFVTSWPILLLSLWAITNASAEVTCRLNPDFKYVSLSGPISFLMEELKLMNDRNLKAISLFHEVEGFKGERVGGGVFLSEAKVKEWKNHVVFYDESRELEKTLKHGEGLQLIKIKTRALEPFAATNESLAMLRPYLKFCANAIHKLESEQIALKQKIADTNIVKESHYFFLGKITKEKLPSLLILDGPVLALKRMNKVETLESNLSYLPWSEKAMESAFKNEKTHFWGINESKKNKWQVVSVDKNKKNIFFRGSLIPGITQVKFIQFFMNELQKK